jgi:hypothetical protein
MRNLVVAVIAGLVLSPFLYLQTHLGCTISSGQSAERFQESFVQDFRDITAKPIAKRDLDILSVASTTRMDYVEAQRRTWGAHPRIRNFFHVTEDDDVEPQCSQQLTNQDVFDISRACRKPGKDTSWIVRRFSNFYASTKWLQKKPSPTGWLCAQKRFPTGLAKVLRTYKETNEALPSFLVLVDDDTYYNIDELSAQFLSMQDQSLPGVTAGCRVSHGGIAKGVVFPFGGFGLIFTKGTLERLSQPITCHGGGGDRHMSGWETSVCSEALANNLIGEKEVFRNGMSLSELIEAYVKTEKFVDHKNWTRGFCFHGDWFFSYFVQIYHLSSSDMMETMLGSEISGGKYTGLCNNNYEHCNSSSVVCHYQTPDDMERLSKNVEVPRH